jgi:hypothetical protein
MLFAGEQGDPDGGRRERSAPRPGAAGTQRELFAPQCPEGARVDPVVTRFADQPAWCVRAPIPSMDGNMQHYFEVETGHLIGWEGSGLSSFQFCAPTAFGDLALPPSITRFRLEDGLEHVLEIERVTWIEAPENLFERPASVARLLRTPEQIRVATERLRTRFAGVLGSWEGGDGSMIGRVTVSIVDGNLQMTTFRGTNLVDVPATDNGLFRLEAAPVSFRIEFDEAGRPAALMTRYPGPSGMRGDRLARVAD